jgi:serine/threonine protein kinase
MRIFEILEDVNYFYIVSELLFEELSHRLLQRGLFSEKDAAVIFRQILMGINYLHVNNIVHRDIKLENVLMHTDNKDDLTLKITDFGFAKIFDKEELLNDFLGSPLYMAPEIVQKKSYNSAVDIWAAGVLLHILLVGAPPFIATTKKEIF